MQMHTCMKAHKGREREVSIGTIWNQIFLWTLNMSKTSLEIHSMCPQWTVFFHLNSHMSSVNNLPTALCEAQLRKGDIWNLVSLSTLLSVFPAALPSGHPGPLLFSQLREVASVPPLRLSSLTLKEDRAEARLPEINVTALRFTYKNPATLNLGELRGWTEIWILSFFLRPHNEEKKERENENGRANGKIEGWEILIGHILED